MFSSNSFAEWTKVTETANGLRIYVDFGRIREDGGYFYFWHLSDFLKPNKAGSLSAKIYMQADCKLFRFKILSDIYYKGQMGAGKTNGGSDIPSENWSYAPPNSYAETLMNSVCRK